MRLQIRFKRTGKFKDEPPYPVIVITEVGQVVECSAYHARRYVEKGVAEFVEPDETSSDDESSSSSAGAGAGVKQEKRGDDGLTSKERKKAKRKAKAEAKKAKAETDKADKAEADKAKADEESARLLS